MSVEIVIYSTERCPYCIQAKNLLESLGAKYTEKRVDTDAALFREMVEKSGSVRTVPQIFIDGHRVGGFDDLQKLNKSGTLGRILGII